MKRRVFWIVLNIVLFAILLFVINFVEAVETTIYKPILYLYPESDMEINVSFEHPEYIKTSYPKYDDGWQVEAKTNGDIYFNDRYYYALYWDEVNRNIVDFETGFYVDADDATNFLEEKLAIIGLTEREANEFIMYWLPVLEENKKSLVYFELTRERESFNRLIITPEPDSMLRVAIHIKKVNKKVDIKEQNLQTFERNGFTVVEWGGVRY